MARLVVLVDDGRRGVATEAVRGLDTVEVESCDDTVVLRLEVVVEVKDFLAVPDFIADFEGDNTEFGDDSTESPCARSCACAAWI